MNLRWRSVISWRNNNEHNGWISTESSRHVWRGEGSLRLLLAVAHLRLLLSGIGIKSPTLSFCCAFPHLAGPAAGPIKENRAADFVTNTVSGKIFFGFFNYRSLSSQQEIIRITKEIKKVKKDALNHWKGLLESLEVGKEKGNWRKNVVIRFMGGGRGIYRTCGRHRYRICSRQKTIWYSNVVAFTLIGEYFISLDLGGQAQQDWLPSSKMSW